ncbi:DNA cytosine methyltransferase [Bacillus toyonensis]|uniref:DNA cytosine methyltransferase n=1 Tax=Bacillus toyonensis TaxID=155322 RepID=UPI000BF57B17|nr:DNA cytosine methyltransferase [Bacillus toyonensis]PGC94866.1 DNA cytosine methyltransferase [Bacillus toyonensis]
MYVLERYECKVKNLIDENIEKKYKIIDLFAGAGGLSNGFEQTGKFEVIGAVEVNQAATKTYIKNHSDNVDIIIKSKNEQVSDITKINFMEVLREKGISRDETVVIGGPPCQGFSNANRQKNYLISGNNQLVKEFVRAIEEINPVALLMENVKAIESDIHKFFVTEHVEKTKFAYSSEKHLTEIMKNNEKSLEGFVNEDSISLVETRYSYLERIFHKIIKLNFIYPIIESEVFISRLRSIERKALKSSQIQLIKEKEKRDVTKLIKYLESRLEIDKTFEQLEVGPIIERALQVLRKIKDTSVNSVDVMNNVGPLLDLNRFLVHYKEIINEKVVFDKPLKVERKLDKIQVIARVKSYKVVEYLKVVFDYLGYSIDSGVLTASDFGVPQRRNRFMILGVKKDLLSGDQSVEFPTRIFSVHHTTYDAIGDLEDIPPQHEITEYIPQYYKNYKGLTPLQYYYQGGNEPGEIYNHINTKSEDLSLQRFRAIKKTNGKNFHSLSEDLKTTYTDTARTQNTIYLRLKYDEPSPTVVNVRKSMWNHPKNAVAISIREAARLQSFRDNFRFCGTKDQQYQQIGNAVPPLMARAVAEQVLKLFGDKPNITIENEFKV